MKQPSQFMKFLVVGGLSTICQYAVLIGLVEFFRTDPVIASGIGAFFGAVLNYFLNKTATFQSTAKHKTTVPRFIVVAVIAIGLNALLMALFIKSFGIAYIPAQIITTGLIIFFTYNANRFWTFKQ